MMQRRMLSKEDEVAAGDDTEVRREDQEKINRFSRLHQRQTVLEGQLKAKLKGRSNTAQKDKEDLEEISTELELADEDELVPYKIGDAFVQLPLTEAQELLADSTQQIDAEVSSLEEKMSELRDELQGLKVALYARFGRSINLET
ncbi:Prefoldin subunit-domain-containing protein [Aspergillus floccosus]